ncbi:MAG: DUF4365 domain-containing protein [Planctomycetes bacterium]|nr:DUF4365 domain-containing protein [Planctomycetota bacterium]
MPSQNPKKKRRTREHVIADLSVNHVERHALLCGGSVERIEHDYGIDLLIATYDREGERENGEIRLQVKATDHPRLVSGGKSIAVRVDSKDFRHWLLEPMPVILVIYDAKADVAHWLYVQAYFESLRQIDLDKEKGRLTIHIPRENVINPASFGKFAEFRDTILAQLRRVVRHG